MKNKLVVASMLSLTLSLLSLSIEGMPINSPSNIMKSSDSDFSSESGAKLNIDTKEGKEKLSQILDNGPSVFSSESDVIDIRDDEMSSGSDANMSSSSLSFDQISSSSSESSLDPYTIYPDDLKNIQSIIKVDTGEEIALVRTSPRGFSCGFRALTLDRETVDAPGDKVRKNIINKLVQGIKGEIPGIDRNEVMRLMIPQLQYYISSGGFLGWGEIDEDLNTRAWLNIYPVFQKETKDKVLRKPFRLKSGEVITTLGSENLFNRVYAEAENNISDIVDRIRHKLLADNAFVQSLDLTEEEHQIVLSNDEVFSVFKTIYPEFPMAGLNKNSFKRAPSLAASADQIYALNRSLSKEEIQKKITILKETKKQILDWIKVYEKESELREDLEAIKENEDALEDLYFLPLTCQAYFEHYIGQEFRMLEMTNVGQTGILDAIAYVQKASLKLFADMDFHLNYEHFLKGQLIHSFENPNAETEIYAFMRSGHYSKGLPKRYLSPDILPENVKMIVYPSKITMDKFPKLNALDSLDDFDSDSEGSTFSNGQKGVVKTLTYPPKIYNSNFSILGTPDDLDLDSPIPF